MKPIEPWTEANDADSAALELVRSLPRPAPPSLDQEMRFAETLARGAFPAPPAGPFAGLSLGAKAMILASTGALLGAGAAFLLQSSDGVDPPRPDLAPQVEHAAQEQPATEALQAIEARWEATQTAPENLTRPDTSPTAAKAASPQNRGHLSPVDLLRMEEELLERARRSLGGNPREALALLRRHQENFPRGQLVAERLFMMTSAYAALGEQSAAQNVRDELLRRFPRSGYAARLQADMKNQPAKE